MAYLNQTNKDGSIVKEHTLFQGECKIGREYDCQVILSSDQYGSISRYHAVIKPTGHENTWELYDLGSANGTFINGKKISSCQVLRDGDKITLGRDSATFLFKASQSAGLQIKNYAKLPLNNALDTIEVLTNLTNTGDQIDLIFAIAVTTPKEIVFARFKTLYEDMTDLLLRALALRGFGKISHPQIKLYQSNDDIYLLKLLCTEIKGNANPTNDLTKWAAATAVTEIGYSPLHIQSIHGGGLAEQPNLISNEIVHNKIAQISDRNFQRFNLDGTHTPEYRKTLDFWAYGPTEELFNHPQLNNDDIKNVLKRLQVRGIELGLRAGNKDVRVASYALAKNIFGNYLATKNVWLEKSLKRFLMTEYCEETDPSIITFSKAICYEKTVNRPNHLDLTLNELYGEATRTTKSINEIDILFQTAEDRCSSNELTSFLRADRTKYIDYENSWLIKIGETISSLKVEQKSIEDTQSQLNQGYKQLAFVNSELYQEVSAITNQESLISSQEFQTLSKAKKLSNEINSLKSSFASLLNSKTIRLKNRINEISQGQITSFFWGLSPNISLLLYYQNQYPNILAAGSWQVWVHLVSTLVLLHAFKDLFELTLTREKMFKLEGVRKILIKP